MRVPKERGEESRRPPQQERQTERERKHLLLGSLAEVALGRVELGLEQGDLALEALAGSLGGLALVQAELGLGNLVLSDIELLLLAGELVLQRCDLVLLLGELVLQALGLGSGSVGTGSGIVDLDTEGSEFLLSSSVGERRER